MRESWKKRILVTGGAGFLGSHLCDRLVARGDDVLCVDNFYTGSKRNVAHLLGTSNFELLRHDVTFPLYVEVDEIYNLACPASPVHYQHDPVQTTKTSVHGAINMLGLAKRCKAKILQASTSEVYGDPDVHPQPENYFGNVNTMGERSCYDEGKRIGETLIYEYRKKHGVDLKVVRIFNTYGPYMDINDGRVITNFIKQILNNETLNIYGNGNQTRSFCYVDDMIDGLIRMMKSNEAGPINIGNPYCEFTLNELVKVFEKIMNRKLPVTYMSSTENDPKQRRPVILKAQILLGFEPKIELVTGIQKTLEYFSNTHEYFSNTH